MKLLRKLSSLTEAKKISEQLRVQGVLTFISSEQSKNMGGVFTGALEVGIWVVLDNQFKDAMKFIDDPNYTIENPLTDDEMSVLEEQSTNCTSNVMERFFNITMSIFLGMLLLSVLGYVIYNILK